MLKIGPILVGLTWIFLLSHLDSGPGLEKSWRSLVCVRKKDSATVCMQQKGSRNPFCHGDKNMHIWQSCTTFGSHFCLLCIEEMSQTYLSDFNFMPWYIGHISRHVEKTKWRPFPLLWKRRVAPFSISISRIKFSLTKWPKFNERQKLKLSDGHSKPFFHPRPRAKSQKIFCPCMGFSGGSF